MNVEYSSWRHQLRLGLSPRQQRSVELERAARLVRMVEISVIPGLAQTAEYARNVFEIALDLYETPRDVERAVAARMKRQRVLHDTAKRFEVLVVEAALRYPVCPPEAMADQVDRLIAVATLPNVRFGVIPLNSRLPLAPMHGYWIIDDVVMVETFTGEIISPDPDEVALYNRLTDRLWDIAAEGEHARTILAASVRQWAALARSGTADS